MADKDKDKPADDNKIDHYVKQGVIATGKHAQVWEVQEENTSNRFALKVLLPEAMLESEQIAILKYEGKVAQSLDHPNIIKWIATVHRKTNIYLVLELFRAYNVKNYLAVDTLGVHMRLRKLIDCTCLALQHMHERGWVHMDVKPDNILLNRSSEVKLIDFSLTQKIKSGLGKLLGGSKSIGGTLTYIAPETLRKEALTAQTDIYSFGITIFECLTGVTPIKGSSPKDLMLKQLSAVPAPPSEINKNVTPEMDRMVLRMLAKKPKDRQKSMQEIMSEFRNIQIFKEDPEKLLEQKAEAAKKDAALPSLGKRLDSRTDHKRSEDVKANPELAKQHAANAPPQPKAKIEPPKPAAAAKPAATKPLAKPQPAAVMPTMPMPQPMMPGYQQPMMPGYQQPMMPGYQQPMMPGYQQPMMPGYQQPMMPGQMPGYPPGTGMPMPGVPQVMPGQMPQMPQQQQRPALPVTLATPVPPGPVAVQPQPPRPVAPRPLQRPAPPPPPKDADDLPSMEELPDVL